MPREGVATRTVVAATKLRIPKSRRPLVARPDLTARLEEDHRLTLVSAPAGYGKTAAIASWAAGHSEHVAWLSCDPTDVEPTRFMSCLLSAIAARWPGVADDAFVLLDREGASTHDPAVAVANELATVDTPGVIVVDDLHLAAPSPAVLTAFIEALPEGFRFVAGTRSDPPLSLARLRLHGDLLELRSDDLRFGAQEMADFFALQDVPLTSDELLRLHELTEGWPAAVQLAAIALQRDLPRDEFLQAFAGTDRAVGDFLVSEVLASLAPELVDFLVVTSVLDAFDANLCKEVTGSNEAGALLERLLAADLFVVPLDDRAHWYRYHHLFGAFLRARLGSMGSAKLAAAHERASLALEDRRDIEGSLQHAMAIGDVARAGQILHTAIGRSMSMSAGAEVTAQALRLWLHEFGAAFIETDPTWVLEFLMGLISLSGPDDASQWLERVERAHPDADGELRALIQGAWSEHHQHRGQPLEAIRRLGVAMKALGGTLRPPGLLTLLPSATARACVQAGDLAAAGAILEQSLAEPVGNAVPDAVRHPGLGAYVAAAAGDLGRAESLASSTLRSADRLGLERHELGIVYAGLARVEVHLERDEREPAERILREVTQATDTSHRLALQNTVTLQRAKLARTLGDEADAAALLALARLGYSEPDKAVRQVFGVEAVEQALRFDPSNAADLIAELDQERVETQVLYVRLAVLEHDAATAIDLLHDLPPATTRRAAVERDVLTALSLLERDLGKANDHLHAALSAAQPEKMVRTITDHGPDVHRMLQSFAPDASNERYVAALLAAASHMVAPVRASSTPPLVEPLSSREVTVLRYLCSRLTYREIAAALYVSLNTLKSHVRSVYRKLDVTSRSEAVDAGRRLGLI